MAGSDCFDAAANPIRASASSYTTSDPERHAAVRAVAAHAVDADDLLNLLDTLGLDPKEGRP